MQSVKNTGVSLFTRVGLGMLMLICTATSHAQFNQQHGPYTVHYSVFDSSFLLPDVAKAYGLVRGNGLYLVNISVNKQNAHFGQAVKLEGTATNLMQQQKTLQFQAIDEGDATYYIAPLRVASPEVLHFALDIQAQPDEEAFRVKFTHKFTRH